VPKLPVRAARVTPLGLEGDVQRLVKIHGGPDRAVCLFSQEVIDELRAEGHPIVAGAAGENVTIAGLAWSSLASGDVIELGDVVVQLTTITDPCKQIAACFADRKPSHVLESARTRWYARVLVPGELAVGAPVRFAVDAATFARR
jgi:MOSC domain-containing protein YiiM